MVTEGQWVGRDAKMAEPAPWGFPAGVGREVTPYNAHKTEGKPIPLVDFPS